MTEAMPNMRLPFASTNPVPTVMALDRAVFEGGYSGSTSELVDADVSDGNRGFALHGDVANALGYHLWALALVMETEYKARPMHTSVAYDVSAFYRLRKVGHVRPPPAAASAATVARYAEVKLLDRIVVRQMCDAFGIAPTDASERGGAAALARLDSCVSEDTGEAVAFWPALGNDADKSAMVPMACMAVVRAGSRPAAGGGLPRRLRDRLRRRQSRRTTSTGASSTASWTPHSLQRRLCLCKCYFRKARVCTGMKQSSAPAHTTTPSRRGYSITRPRW